MPHGTLLTHSSKCETQITSKIKPMAMAISPVLRLPSKSLRLFPPSSFPSSISCKLPSWFASLPQSKPPSVAFLHTTSTFTKFPVAMQASTSDYATDIGEILGDVSIFNAAGKPVMLRDLWDQNEGIAVVALLRHFGCICCWEFASELKAYKSKFDSAGVKLIAIGVGEPDKARILSERLPFPADCLYADPNRKAYDVLGLHFGFGRTFFNRASAKVLSRFDALRSAGKNYTIKATPNDRKGVLQQGGMFVFKGKQLLYARKDEGTGDHASLDDVFNVCCKVPVA